MADNFQFIPNDAVDAESRSDLADSWAADERAKLAQRWADAQRAAAPPVPLSTPPIRDDWATPQANTDAAPPAQVQSDGQDTAWRGQAGLGGAGQGVWAGTPVPAQSSPPTTVPVAQSAEATGPSTDTSTPPAVWAPSQTSRQTTGWTPPTTGSRSPEGGGYPSTTAGISGGIPQTVSQTGGAFYGLDDSGMQVARAAGDMARQLGYGDEGAHAVQSVLLTEGGLTGARGDYGRSAGPLQFYAGGGQMDNFAKQNGMSVKDAQDYVEQNPLEAIRWALGTQDRPGYLGAALKYGISKGLTGPDLAAYIQAKGQISQSPERAGQWHNVLFSNGSDPFSAESAAQRQTVGLNANQPGGGSAGPGASTLAPGMGYQVPTAADVTNQQRYQNQFQLGLDDASAYAACGPSAAIAFAEAYGRNPTADEAMQLARQVGWSQQTGMAGVASEQGLLNRLGVSTKLEQDVDWNHVASDANNGNPVILSTPGHYFYIDGTAPGPGGNTLFHVGASGTALKGGSEYMTVDQIQQRMGRANGALYADHPLAEGPSVAEGSPTAPVSAPLVASGGGGSPSQPGISSPGDIFSAIGQKANDLKAAVAGFAQNPAGALPTFNPTLDPNSPIARQARGEPTNPLEVQNQVSSGLADTLVPPNTPVLSGAAQLALNPATLYAGGAGGVAAMAAGTAGSELARQGARALGGDETAQTVAGLVGMLVGSLSPAALERAVPGLAKLTITRQAGETVADAGARLAPQVQAALETTPAFQAAAPAEQAAMRQAANRALNDALVIRPPEEGVVGRQAEAAGSDTLRQQAINASASGRYPSLPSPDVVAPAGGTIAEALPEDVARTQAQLDFQAARNAPDVFGGYPKSFGPEEGFGRNAPTGAKPTIRIPSSRVPIAPVSSEAAAAIKRLDSGDESALDDLLKIDKSQEAQAPVDTTGFGSFFGQGTGKALGDSLLQKELPAAEARMAGLRAKYPRMTDEQAAQTPLGQQISRMQADAVQRGIRPATAKTPDVPAGETVPAAQSTEASARGTSAGSAATPVDVRPPATPVTQSEKQADALLRQYAPDLFTEEGLQRLTRGTVPSVPAGAAASPLPDIFGPTELAAGLSPAAVGRAAEPIGRFVASALSPTENLDPAVRQVVEQYANMVGRNSDAASVIANNYLRQIPPAQRSQPGVAAAIQQQVRQTLRDGATKNLVADLETQGLAAKIGTYRPAGWKLVSDVPGSPLSRYAFDPSVVGPVKAVTAASAIAANPVGNAILKTTGTAKQTIFSLSNFHTVTEGINAAFSSPETLKSYAFAFASNDFAQGLRGSMASTLADAARSGVTGLVQRAGPDVEGQIGNLLWRRVVSGGVSGIGGAAAGYTETKIAGGSEDDARRNALILGLSGAALGGVPALRGKTGTTVSARSTVAETLQSALWDRAVPLAKVTAWKGLVNGGLDKATAARVVNERFGGLNYAAMGRDPTLMDATRLLAMAPDWNESTIRQLGSAIFGGSGQGVRAGFIAKTIGGMMAATEVANYALSGHSTLSNQPGHQFEIEVTDPKGGYMHVGILPGNLQAWLNLANKEQALPDKRASSAANFATGRLAAAPQMAGETYQTLTAGNRKYGLPYDVAKAGPVGILSRLSPIGESQVIQGVEKGGLNPLVAGAMAAAGLNPRYDKPGSSGSSAQRYSTRP